MKHNALEVAKEIVKDCRGINLNDEYDRMLLTRLIENQLETAFKLGEWHQQSDNFTNQLSKITKNN